MRLKLMTASLATGLALATTPALADKPENPGQGHGKTTAPGQLCKGQSHKKTNHGKGKSPFAACVVGAKRAQREAARTQDAQETEHTAPAKLCKDQSRKKDANDKKSPFAACVTGAAKAQQAS